MNLSISTLILLVATGAIIGTNANTTTVPESSIYRLNSHVLPISYDIWLKPYLLATDGERRFTFDGEVNVTLYATQANTSEITLHAHLINLANISLYNDSNAEELLQTFTYSDIAYDGDTHQLTLILKDQLTLKNKFRLRFAYTGQIRDGMQGFFRANYTDHEGNEKWIGVTQSQRIDARTIFPCFDEPALKAKFSLQLSRPKNYRTVFNTELLESIPDGDDRMLDRFAATPPMSTYLVAFIVSEFEEYGSDELKIITRAEYQNKTHFAYEVAERAINAYDAYTQQPYKELGLDVMQMAGSPKFPHNGMENWGLVIYTDDVLVNEPDYTDGWSNKEYTLSVIVHETAHMWFGNSVTFAWWSYFWLNEAFARYYQYFMAHQLYPEYHLDQQFVVNQIHLIFGIDAVGSTQPMTSPEESINTPSEIGYKFSSIAYAKGAAIIRMIANLMGLDNFDNAIRAYLKEYYLKNTTPEDLFKHLKQHWPSSHQVDLDAFFHDWTEQVGFPVLFVNINDKHEIELTQQRFILGLGDGSNDTLTYTIPITYATNVESDFNNLTARFYVPNNMNKTFTVDKPFKWIIFNLQQSNYYRVFYDMTTLKHIKTALSMKQHDGIPPTNRAQLIDDSFNFARIAMMDYDEVFQFLEYIENDTDYLPWYATFSNMQFVAQRLTLQQQSLFVKYLDDIMTKIYTHLGFTRSNETVLDIYNRNKVVSWACKYHLFKCGGQAQEFFNTSIKVGNKPTPDFRETLYCSATRDGAFFYYQTLNEWFEKEKLNSEKKKLIYAMGCTRYFYAYHYARILNGDIPSDYAAAGITPMYAENPENVEPVFIMITNTSERLAERIGWPSVANVIKDIANYLTTPEQKQILDDFVTEKGEYFGNSFSTLQIATATVELNLEWAKLRLPKLIHYFEKRNSAGRKSVTVILLIFVCIIQWFL
uniref:Aminopeptidase n=2 Tax=Ceratitis capitata TaxID=7213 RepID=W8BYW8_CERCA